MGISMLNCSDLLSVAVIGFSYRNQDPSRETVAALWKSYLCVEFDYRICRLVLALGNTKERALISKLSDEFRKCLGMRLVYLYMAQYSNLNNNGIDFVFSMW